MSTVPMSGLEKGKAISTHNPWVQRSKEKGISGDFNRDSISTTCTSTPLTDCNICEVPENGKEGRVERWRRSLTILGAFCSLFCTFGQMNSFGTFQTWYAIHQLHGVPSSTISWIGSLQLWVFFFSGSAVGYLFDIYGPTVLMACGTVCFVLGTVLTSISTHYYHFILSQGVMFGIGVGLLFYPALASISKSFTAHRATALGIAASGSSLGGVLYPIMLRSLFEHVGFGWTLRITALISLVLCGIATLTVSSPDVLDSPEQGRASCELSTRLGDSGLGDSRFWGLTLGSSFVAFGLFTPIFYLSSFAHETLSISPSSSFLFITALNAGGIFGRIAPSILSDRLGHFNLLFPSAFLSGLLVLTGWFIPASKAAEIMDHLRSMNGNNSKMDTNSSEAHELLVTLIVFAVLYGVFSGAFISLINPCVVKITKDVKVVGRRIGIFYSMISFPSLIGSPVAGALLSSGHGSYEGMILFSGITLVIGSLFILATRFSINHSVWVCI